jgi:hypothetical protein
MDSFKLGVAIGEKLNILGIPVVVIKDHMPSGLVALVKPGMGSISTRIEGEQIIVTQQTFIQPQIVVAIRVIESEDTDAAIQG